MFGLLQKLRILNIISVKLLKYSLGCPIFQNLVIKEEQWTHGQNIKVQMTSH